MNKFTAGILSSALAISMLTGCSSVEPLETKYMEVETSAKYYISMDENIETENNIGENTEVIEENAEADVEKTAAELIHLPNSEEKPEDIDDTDKVLISMGKDMETVVSVITNKDKEEKSTVTPIIEKVEEPKKVENVEEPKKVEKTESIADTNTDDNKVEDNSTVTYYFNRVSAPGTLIQKNENGLIDYSNTADGYIMIKFTKQTDRRLKARVIGPNTTYTYNIPVDEWQSLVLSDGNGKYKVALYEHIDGTKYATRLVADIDVVVKDEFSPFLHSNQYVDFENAPETQKKAAELVAGQTETIRKVEKIYNYVVKEFTYDKAKANSVQSGYLPNLDKVLSEKTGICFDYASLMTGMLRSQGIPCKLVVGYVGEAYHAWIDVWSDSDGWINGVIQFRMNTWERMDPTFASSGGQSEKMIKYIGDGKNYSAKYYY